MEIVKVFSPVEDKEIKKNLKDSPIWRNAYHADELVAGLTKHSTMFEYVMKFDGTKPIQCTKVSRYK